MRVPQLINCLTALVYYSARLLIPASRRVQIELEARNAVALSRKGLRQCDSQSQRPTLPHRVTEVHL
jgi:hypothetical protein